MKSTGIVRRVDELGRIVIPIELRTQFGIAVKDPIEIFVDGTNIILKKYEESCIFCGNTMNLKNFKGKYETRCEMFKNGNLNAFSYENLIGHVKSTEDNIRMDNTEYPMSYEQFKNRVIELFLKTGNKKDKIKFLNELLEEDPCYIKNMYRHVCYRYERTYLNPPEMLFDDDHLPGDLDMLY